MRAIWDRIMIALMVGVIGFCLFEIWNGTDELLRCALGIGGGAIVIFLKYNTLRHTSTKSAPP